MHLPPQPVFLASFGNYTHLKPNEIWRLPLSLTVTTAAEMSGGTLLFLGLAARPTHQYFSIAWPCEKSHRVAQVGSVRHSAIKAVLKVYR